MNRREENKKKKYIYHLIADKKYKELLERIDNIKELLLKDTQLLLKVIQVYEILGYDQEAEDLLLYICENKENTGRAELYKLAELCTKLEDVEHIEEVYREYLKNWPQSPERFIIGYYTAYTKKDLPENRLHYLEQYCAIDLKENWAYELAKLYKELDRTEECADICHDLIFLFGMGSYVQKAVVLLQECRDLTEAEKAKIAELKDDWEKRNRQIKSKEEKKVLSFRNQMYVKHQKSKEDKDSVVKPVILSFENGIPTLHEKERQNIQQTGNFPEPVEIPVQAGKQIEINIQNETEESVMERIQQHLEQMIVEINQLYEADDTKQSIQSVKTEDIKIKETNKETTIETTTIQTPIETNMEADTIKEKIKEKSVKAENDAKESAEVEDLIQKSDVLEVLEELDSEEEFQNESFDKETFDKEIFDNQEDSIQKFTTYLIQYANDRNAELDEMAYLTVTLIADKKQRLGIALTTELAEEMINHAIDKNKNKSILSIKQFKQSKSGKLILDDKCFE